MSGPYTLLLLDADQCELSNTEYESKRLAVSMASEKIASGEYQDWRTAQILDAAGEIIWDKFARVSA